MRRASSPVRSLRHAVVIAVTWLASLACAGDDASEQAEGEPSDDAEQDEGETGEPPPPLGDRCEDTLLIVEAPTTVEATLRHASPDPDGIAASCGLTGPSVFVKASLHGRADLLVSARGRGFVPRLAVMLPGCSSDPSRVLACGEDLPVTLADLGPDLDLLYVVGVDADDPVLGEAPSEQSDPLDFELRLEARAVLGELERCGPELGRCEAGTVCLPGDEDGVVVDRCRRPPADSCVAPGTTIVPSPGASVVIEIPSTEPHSDAHQHECTGWRRPERVERLELPEAIPGGASLAITADDPRVGLALRGPDCLPEHALACAPATTTGDSTTLSFSGAELASLAAASEAPLLFIELPNPQLDADPPAQVQVTIELLE